MSEYQVISDETRTRLSYLAQRVQADLAMAGLPLVPEFHGLHPWNVAGAEVAVDSLVPDGVLVSWHSQLPLYSAALAVRADNIDNGTPTAPNPNARWMDVIADSMREAMRGILTGAGWPVTDHDTGHDVLLHVGHKQEETPWQAWHSAEHDRQSERMREALNAQHRQVCDRHEGEETGG